MVKLAIFALLKKEVGASKLPLHLSTFVDHLPDGHNTSLFQLTGLQWHRWTAPPSRTRHGWKK